MSKCTKFAYKNNKFPFANVPILPISENQVIYLSCQNRLTYYDIIANKILKISNKNELYRNYFLVGDLLIARYANNKMIKVFNIN